MANDPEMTEPTEAEMIILPWPDNADGPCCLISKMGRSRLRLLEALAVTAKDEE